VRKAAASNSNSKQQDNQGTQWFATAAVWSQWQKVPAKRVAAPLLLLVAHLFLSNQKCTGFATVENLKTITCCE
jgi:hypothetical protein